MKLKILIAWSGGKDSQASLIWANKNPDWKDVEKEAIFCDTGWEHEWTYKHVKEIPEMLGIPLTIVESKKYDGMMGLVEKKKRFPSIKARFCTEELKSKPMIDYILNVCSDYNLIIVQGIRADESRARSKMTKGCTYFKYYKEPYGHDKHDKPKYHKHRRKEVLEHIKTHMDDVYRPIFDWSSTETLSYILENGQKPNPLYYTGVARVGCMPCVLVNQKEAKVIFDKHPAVIDKITKAEEKLGRTFFGPDYIPKRYRTKLDKSSGVMVPTVKDVARYLADKNATMELFPDESDSRCMSYYSMCE